MVKTQFDNIPWKIKCPYCAGAALHLNGYKYNCENCSLINMEGRATELWDETAHYFNKDTFRANGSEQIKPSFFYSVEELADIRKHIAQYRGCVIADTWNTIALKADGTVVTVGDKYTIVRDIEPIEYRYIHCEYNTGHWRNIVAIAKRGGPLLGLRSDGTVAAIGRRDEGRCDTDEWRDIVAIAAGYNHSIGLKSDGTVVAVGDNDYGQCNTGELRNIVEIVAGSQRTIGLRSDRTAVAVGDNRSGQCNVGKWRDIVAIDANFDHTIGLKADGTVVTTDSSQHGQHNINKWRDIVAIETGSGFVVGLKADGTVVSDGSNKYGQCNTGDWQDIVAIYVTPENSSTIGLKLDGTVVAAGNNTRGQCNTSGWRNVGPISKEQVERRRVEDEQAERKRIEDEIKQSKLWESQGRCRQCGAPIVGLFVKRCEFSKSHII